MDTTLARRVRLGVVAFILTGVVTVIGLLLRGPNTPASGDPQAWAEAAAGGTHALGWLVLLPGPVLQLFAFLALWAVFIGTKQERMAFTGAMLSIAGNALYLPFLGLSAFLDAPAATQYLAGHEQAVDVVRAAMFEGVGLLVLLLSVVVLIAGVVLASIAIWRSGFLPRIPAILYVAQAVALTIAAQFAYAVELTGGILLLVSSVWLGAAMWKRAGTPVTAPRAATISA